MSARHLPDIADTEREQPVERRCGVGTQTVRVCTSRSRNRRPSCRCRGQLNADSAVKTLDLESAEAIQDEAHRLALTLNGGEPGIIAHDDARGCVLERETAAGSGSIPLWGRNGEFEITIRKMRVRIELQGIFEIGMCLLSS